MSKNKKTKAVLTAILSLVLVFSVVGCQSNQSKNNKSETKVETKNEKDNKKSATVKIKTLNNKKAELEKKIKTVKKDVKAKLKKEIKSIEKKIETKSEIIKKDEPKTIETMDKKDDVTVETDATTSKPSKPSKPSISRTTSKPSVSRTTSKPKVSNDAPRDKVTTKTITEDKVTSNFRTIDKYKGEKKRTFRRGQNEITRISYKVTYKNGKEVKREKIGQKIVQPKKDKIVETYVKTQDRKVKTVKKKVEDKTKPVYDIIVRDRWFVNEYDPFGENPNTPVNQLIFYDEDEADQYVLKENPYLMRSGNMDPEVIKTDKLLGYETKTITEKVVVQEAKYEWKH